MISGDNNPRITTASESNDHIPFTNKLFGSTKISYKVLVNKIKPTSDVNQTSRFADLRYILLPITSIAIASVTPVDD